MKEFYADHEALLRPNICTHLSKQNEFDPGVKCYEAKSADEYFSWRVILGMFFGVVWTLFLQWICGV